MDKFLDYMVQYVQALPTNTMHAAIFDLDKNYLAITQDDISYYGLSPQQMLGFTLTELIEKYAVEVAKRLQLEHTAFIHAAAQMDECLNRTIARQRPVIAYNFTQTAFEQLPTIDLYTPIWGETGKMVGIYAQAYDLTLFNLKAHLEPDISSQPENPSPLQKKLSPRQKEIAFLLAQGLRPNEICRVLQMTSGALSNIMSKQIAPKFGMEGVFINELIRRIKFAGIDKEIPDSLTSLGYFVID